MDIHSVRRPLSSVTSFFLAVILTLGFIQSPQVSSANPIQEIEINQNNACPVILSAVWEPFKIPFPCFQNGQLLKVKIPQPSRLPGQMFVTLNGGNPQEAKGDFFSIPEYEEGLNTILFVVQDLDSGSKFQISEQKFIVYNAPQLRQTTAPVEKKPYVITLNSGVRLADFTVQFSISENEFQVKALTSTTKVRSGLTLVADLSEAQRLEIAASNQVKILVLQQIITLDVTQNTPSWALDRIDQVSPALDGKFNYGNSGQGVDVYIIDSGIRQDHIEFTGRIREAAYIAPFTTGADCNGHGTHVAGLAAGTAYGVAKLANIISIRVFDCDGYADTSGIVEAINWINARHTQNTPAVVNMSLGGWYDEEFNLVTQSLIDDGIVTVVAAGNEYDDACDYSPSSAPNAITVGASTQDDRDTDFSNIGPCVDIFAPGSSVLSAWWTSNTSAAELSGTSMASPLVAGAAALVLERNFPSYTNKLDANSLVRTTLVNDSTQDVLTRFYVGSGWYTSTPNRLLFVKSLGLETPLTISNTTTTNPVGTFVTLATSGGSGTGATTFTLSPANSTCRLSSRSGVTTLTAQNATTCSVIATKAASAGFALTTSAPKVFTFLGPQSTLTISNATTSGVIGTPITLTTSGGSGNGAVTFIATGSGCTLPTGSATLSANTAATCLVVASKAAEGVYTAATSASRTFTFLGPQAMLTISNSTISNPVRTTVTLTTSGGSGTGATTFALSPANSSCTLSSRNNAATLTSRSATTCTVVATKAAQGAFAATTSEAKTFTFTAPKVRQSTLSISNATRSIAINSSVTLTTSGGSGSGAVSFNVTSGGCTLTGVANNQLTASSAATCSVTATKAADATYDPATSAAVTFTFLGAQATLAISNATTTTRAGTRITLTTTGGSGSGSVTYTVTGSGCSISRSTLSARNPATCDVVATKAAQGAFAAATSAPTRFTFLAR